MCCSETYHHSRFTAELSTLFHCQDPGALPPHALAGQMRPNNLFSNPCGSLATILLIAVLSPSNAEPQWPNAPQSRDTAPSIPKQRYENSKRWYAGNRPVAVRKMSADEGEMFFHEYWDFAPLPLPSTNTNPAGKGEDIYTFLNSSLLLSPLLSPPVLPHSDPLPNQPLVFRALHKRSFTCPTGTSSCASIGASYGCCPTGTTCQLSGSGELGCCPGSEASCSGSTPTQCEAGYTSCPQFHGGSGCCLEGFTCESDGCKLAHRPP